MNFNTKRWLKYCLVIKQITNEDKTCRKFVSEPLRYSNVTNTDTCAINHPFGPLLIQCALNPFPFPSHFKKKLIFSGVQWNATKSTLSA